MSEIRRNKQGWASARDSPNREAKLFKNEMEGSG
jgi:hypothetical protein